METVEKPLQTITKPQPTRETAGKPVHLSAASVERAERIRSIYLRLGHSECTIPKVVEVALIAYEQSIGAALTEPIQASN